MSNKSSSNLLDSGRAIGTYLDDLLQSSTEDKLPVNELASKSEAPVDRLLDDLLQAGTEAIEDETPEIVEVVETVEESIPQFVEQKAEVETLAENSESAQQQAETAQACIATLEFPCQCMMFTVGKLKLAIPLMALKGVHVSDEKLTRLPGSDDLVEGILSYREAQVKVIDSHRLFHQSNSLDSQGDRFYLVLESCEWALTCDQVSDIETINEGDLQSNASSQKIIYGNIRESLTGLLNIANLQSLVAESTGS